MRLCSSTAGFCKDTWKETCSALAEIGFGSVEVEIGSECSGHLEEALNDPELAKEKRDIARDMGLSIGAISVKSDFCAPHKEFNETLETLKPYVDLCANLDADLLCISEKGIPARSSGIHEYMYYSTSIGLKRLEEYADKRGVKLAMENNPEFPARLNHWKAILRGTNSDCVGLCLDPTNFQRPNVEMIEAVKTLSKRIFHAHFRDINPGTGSEIEICEPGAGYINYFALINALHEIEYSGLASIKYDNDRDPKRGTRAGYEYLTRLVGAEN